MTDNICLRNGLGEIERLQAEVAQLHHLLRQALPVLVEAEYLGSALLSDYEVQAVREQIDRVLRNPGLSAPDFVRADAWGRKISAAFGEVGGGH